MFFINFKSSVAFNLSARLKVNKIAARWPAKAVAQFSTSSKKGSDKIVPK